MILRNAQPAPSLQGPRLATLHDVPPPPLPPASASTVETTPQEFATQLSFTDLHHIDDPTGQNRRLFAGWASLEGVAPDRREILNEAFVAGAQAYLDRNPIILWNHKNYLPIGRVLSISFLDKGVWVEGEILRGTEILEQWGDLPDLDGERFPEAQSIAAKAEEAWWLILNRVIRGLSIRGKTFGQVRYVYSEELGYQVEQVLRLDLVEISVAPIQCHPGTRIEAINTLARSLNNTHDDMVQRALSFHHDMPRSKPMDKEKELLELQKKMRALATEVAKENGGTLPEAFAQEHQDLSRALGQNDPADGQGDGGSNGGGNGGGTPIEEPGTQSQPANPGSPSFNMDELKAHFDAKVDEVKRGYDEQLGALHQQISDLTGKPAPRNNRVTLTPQEGAAAKPGTQPAGPGAIQRSLDVLSDTNRHAKGEIPGLPEGQQLLAAKLILAKASSAGKVRIGDGISVSDHEKMILQQVQVA